MIMRGSDPNQRNQQEFEDARRNLQSLAVNLVSWARPALLRASTVLVGELRMMLSHPGSGRWYKSRGVLSRLRGKGTKGRMAQLHRASAPGEPPAPDTGQLRASVGSTETADGVTVGVGKHYAAPLEFGTRSRAAGLARNLRGRAGPGVDRKGLASLLRRASASRSLTQSVSRRGSGHLDPRPFMRPALEKAKPRMLDVVVSDIQTLVARHLRNR